MQRTTGTGFIGFGLVLIVVGAILKFAVTADATVPAMYDLFEREKDECTKVVLKPGMTP